MPTLTASSTFTILPGLQPDPTTINVPVLPVSAPGEGPTCLTHPVVGTYCYDKQPDEWVNIDGDVLIAPIWAHSRTLDGGRNTVWAGHMKDVECIERWVPYKGAAMYKSQLLMLLAVWQNPVDPAVGYTQWSPTYANSLTYDAIITNVTVGGREVTLDWVQKGTGMITGVVEVTWRVNDYATGVAPNTSGGSTSASGVPTISGTPAPGNDLTASGAALAVSGGRTVASIAWQWQRDGSDILGEDEAVYGIHPEDVDRGRSLRVSAVITDSEGDTYARLYSASVVVPEGAEIILTGQPDIAGTETEGQELTASAGSLALSGGRTIASIEWQWERSPVDIAGATSTTYTPTAADLGATLQVSLEFDDDEGHPEGPLVSDETSAIIP